MSRAHPLLLTLVNMFTSCTEYWMFLHLKLSCRYSRDADQSDPMPSTKPNSNCRPKAALALTRTSIQVVSMLSVYRRPLTTRSPVIARCHSLHIGTLSALVFPRLSSIAPLHRLPSGPLALSIWRPDPETSLRNSQPPAIAFPTALSIEFGHSGSRPTCCSSPLPSYHIPPSRQTAKRSNTSTSFCSAFLVLLATFSLPACLPYNAVRRAKREEKLVQDAWRSLSDPCSLYMPLHNSCSPPTGASSPRIPGKRPQETQILCCASRARRRRSAGRRWWRK